MPYLYISTKVTKMDSLPPFSGLLKTRRIEPLYHTNSRSEYRINDPAEAILTNLRLVNVGCTASNNTNPHFSIGLHALIKHIRLEANGREVDSQRFYNRLMLFKEGLVDTNDDKISMQKAMTKSLVGNAYVGPNGGILDQRAKITQVRAAPEDSNGIITTNPLTTATALIELRNVLGFLRAAPMLHPAAMGEIRLIIEYEGNIAIPDAAVNIVQILPPTLIVTYSRDSSVIEQAVQSLSRPITFSTFFVDTNFVPEQDVVGAEYQQTVPFQFKAFDGHYVQRMLQMQEPLALGTQLEPELGILQSVARYKAVDKIFVNGVPMFGGSGIDTPARRSTILHDAFEGAHSNDYFEDLAGVYLNSLTAGDSEFTGYLVGQHVAIFQTEFSRTVVDPGDTAGGDRITPVNSRTNMALVVRMFGEVFRTRMPNGAVVALATQ